MRLRPFGFLLATEPPPKRVGVLAAVAVVAVCTLMIYPLKHDRAGGLAGRRVPAGGARRLGRVGGVAGRAHGGAERGGVQLLPPAAGRAASRSRTPSNWVALVAFVVAAALASSVAEVDAGAHARGRGAPARGRSRGGDGAAAAARATASREALPTAAARLAQALELHSAAIEMEAVEGDERRVAFPLREGTRRLGTLLVGADTLGGEPAAAAGARGAGAGGAAERGARARARCWARWSRRRRCAARTWSRRRCCARSRTTCARR